MKKLKYMCHKCCKRSCRYRQLVTEVDFKNGVAEYCEHGFEGVYVQEVANLNYQGIVAPPKNACHPSSLRAISFVGDMHLGVCNV